MKILTVVVVALALISGLVQVEAYGSVKEFLNLLKGYVGGIIRNGTSEGIQALTTALKTPLPSIINASLPSTTTPSTTTSSSLDVPQPTVAASEVKKKCPILGYTNYISNSLIKADPDFLWLQLHSLSCPLIHYPLYNAHKMWRSTYFDRRKSVALLIAGWGVDSGVEAVNALSKAYACREDTNFLAVNMGSQNGTFLTWSSEGARRVGDQIAGALVKLLLRVPLKNIHLIGYGTGAHIAGYVGIEFRKKTSMSLPRITALGPAEPCFDDGLTMRGLRAGLANFIDVIHTNPDDNTDLGDADFHPGGLGRIQPGCGGTACSQSRSWEYYAESVYPGYEDNFIARRCDMRDDARTGPCFGQEVSMGYGIHYGTVGIFYLDVNAKEPFGQVQTPLKECSSCKPRTHLYYSQEKEEEDMSHLLRGVMRLDG